MNFFLSMIFQIICNINSLRICLQTLKSSKESLLKKRIKEGIEWYGFSRGRFTFDPIFSLQQMMGTVMNMERHSNAFPKFRTDL